MSALKTLGNYYTLPTKKGYAVVGPSSFELMTAGVFRNDGRRWEYCPIEDFLSAYNTFKTSGEMEVFNQLGVLFSELNYENA